MKKLVSLLIAGWASCIQSPAQFTYTQVTSGLTDVYESGNTILGLGDIDHDGDVDILSVGDHYGGVGLNEDGIMVFKNNGSGTGWTKTMSGVFGYGGVALGDVNNDGLMDVAYGIHHNYGTTDFGDQVLEVVLGDGTGLNWTPWDDNLGLQGQSWGMFGCDLADVNNDGLLDLGANSFGCCDGVWIYKNNGNGTWTTLGGALNGNSSMQFRFGDFNRDGNTDFIVSNSQYNNQSCQVWENTGNSSFIPMNAGLPFTGGSGDYLYKMDVADVNHDGAADIAITYGGYARVYTYNTSTNAWANISSGLPTTSQSGLLVALGDLDKDGHVDLATYKSSLITFYKGNGSGNWAAAATLPIPETTGYDLKVADVDHNGYPDLVYWAKYNGSNMLRVYLQTTPAAVLSLSPVFPNGGEFFYHGSAQRIHWTSSVPSPSSATVDIGFSSTGALGPFSSIVTGAPNSGTYQWAVPVASSGNCYLTFTLDDGISTFTAVTAAPFCIDTCLLITGIDLDISVFLEGPFNTADGTMTTWLNVHNYLPVAQPYNTAPWNYYGTENVAVMPGPDVVDWVLVELRDAPDAASATSSTMIARQAAFLLKNGEVRGIDGASLLTFDVSITEQLFVVVWHRSHLGVMSAAGVPASGNVHTWDFSAGAGQAAGGANGHKQLAAGIWGMFSGDGNADRQVANGDKLEVWIPQSGSSGYKSGDFNLDGQVNNVDKIEYWVPNSGRSCQVPD